MKTTSTHITLAFIGGPKHGHVTSIVQSQHREVHVAIPKEVIPLWEPPNPAAEHDSRFEVVRYERRILQIPNTHRRMEYLVLANLSDDEALALVNKFEDSETDETARSSHLRPIH